MIFAKLDVCFWRHKKFVRAGAAAAGYFAAALAYLREDESRDGILDSEVLGQLFGLGEREARKLCDRLVEVDLFARHERGYILLGYATKNETKDEIAARRAATATRVANSRAKRGNGGGNGVHGQVRNSECNALQGVLVPGSDSDSVSDFGERDSRGSTGGPSPPPLVESGTVPVSGERYVRVDDPLTPELEAAAGITTVRDIPGAWLKFCGYYADKWIHVAGRWQAWCVREAKTERTERERERQRGKDSASPLTAEGLDPNSFEASQLRKARRKKEDALFFEKRLALAKASGEIK